MPVENEHLELEDVTVPELQEYVEALQEKTISSPGVFRFRWQRTIGGRFARELRTSDIADLVAQEHGFEDWTDIVKWLEYGPRTQTSHWLMDRLLRGVELSENQISAINSWFACEMALAQEGARELLTDDLTAHRLFPPFDTTPLVYVCCSAVNSEDPATRERRRQLAKALLDMGSNPSHGLRENRSIRGFLTCVGGAVSRAQDPKLVEMLLEAGADPADGPTLYEGGAVWEAVRRSDLTSLELLCKAQPPEWILCHALTHSLQYQDMSMTNMLLEHGADPNWNKTVFGMEGNALHEAIHCGCSREMVQTLIDHNASLKATDRGGRTPLAIATAYGNTALCELLVDAGADTSEVSHTEQWVGAAFRNSRKEAFDLSTQFPPDHEPTYHDHLWLNQAAQQGEVEVVKHLIEKLDPNQIDYQGKTPLHQAVPHRKAELIGELIVAQANPSLTDFLGDTPVDSACRNVAVTGIEEVEALQAALVEEQFVDESQGHRVRAHDEPAFEMAADAVSQGDLGTLQELFDRYPYFNQARSLRAHHCTLLNYLGVNGIESERTDSPDNVKEVIEFLLERGCDPNALCYTYRGGPGENTIGLFSSSGLVSAPKQLEMIRTLVRGGADLHESGRIAISLLDAADEGNLIAAVGKLDLTSQDVQGAWFEIVELACYDIMAALLDAGIEIDTTNELNQTALHWAAYFGNEERVDWLLDRHANVNLIESQHGGTPAGWADAGGHPELAKRLAALQD